MLIVADHDVLGAAKRAVSVEKTKEIEDKIINSLEGELFVETVPAMFNVLGHFITFSAIKAGNGSEGIIEAAQSMCDYMIDSAQRMVEEVRDES